ncbi:transmembrane protein 248 [Diretmus argenteus]
MMGFWQPVNNLRDYVSQNPPVVTFFLCLLALALSFICLSSYVHTHTLPNPDTLKDWNHLLSSMSLFQLCARANASSVELVSPVPSPLVVQETDGKPSVNATTSPLPFTHLHLKVPLVVTYSSASHSLKDLALHTTLVASQLGLADCAANEKINSTVHVVPLETSASHTCYSLQSKHDPKLTVMLTKEQQDVVGRHLLEVSVCLLGVCLILCLSASLTHSLPRRYHGNGLDLHSEPLIDS